MSPRVLSLRALGLGDFLTGVPALRGLRRALPGHTLVLAAPEALRPLAELSGAVDRLLPTGELEQIAWPGAPPEVAVDLHGNGPETKRLLEVLHPRRLVAFAGPVGDGSRLAGPRWDPDEHEVRRWCRLVDAAFGRHADPEDLLLAVPSRPPAAVGAAVVHPGAASASRRWPAERFAAVARHLARSGERPLVTGSPAEEPLVQRVVELAGLPPEAALGPTDLADLAALVAHARVVVCGDTGVAHLASAYRTPSVVIFGPTPPKRWGPPASGPHTVLWRGSGVGDPHGSRPDPALLRVSVPEVLTSLDGALTRTTAAG
ncbi:glycosyltransferase family 9 protein [Nocardioides sp. cx-169]|uniref:glycosyltransferase family 9 protein n=1 Tax=Nocardioides sp. cx-169 TaxID=2899080 RepID=UPI001E443C3C|nr:glycosyltransferase family 9 protein [Nocardioides sp. cx-169]MCD4532562.1 glycosyltransferase family 9 protein [Nocardioides sp. cx-169]